MPDPNDKIEEQDEVLQENEDVQGDFNDFCAEISELKDAAKEVGSYVARDSFENDYNNLLACYPQLTNEEKIQKFGEFLANNFTFLKGMVRAQNQGHTIRTTSVANDLWLKLSLRPFDLKKYSKNGFQSFRGCLNRTIRNMIVDKIRTYSATITRDFDDNLNAVGTLSFNDQFATIIDQEFNDDSSYEQIANNFMAHIQERMSAKIQTSGLPKWQRKRSVFTSFYFEKKSIDTLCSETGLKKSTLYNYLNEVKEILEKDAEVRTLCEEYYALRDLMRQTDGVVTNPVVPVKPVNKRVDVEKD